jgi:uncharacterized protein YecE (DUF72 family)
VSVDLFVGTSGYNYKEWKGPFYPDGLPDREMLGYYAARLRTVEINNTFYRVPKAGVVDAWVAQVPDNFRFVVKATRRITHIKRLKDADEETRYFLSIADHFGPTLGAILFQLPPFLRKDLDRLRAFLDLLPAGMPAAFEFRHETWYEPDVFDLLSQRNAALCVAHEDDDAPGEVEKRFVPTASWGYLRLRASGYTDRDLSAWHSRIREQAWDHAFVFFKHEEEGAAPALARRFLEASA